jgi:hypothetical protein
MIAAMGETTSGDMLLQADVPCARCGYNLRTLRVDGRCPECAADVGASIWTHRRKQKHCPQAPELLSTADPRWIRQLRFGAAMSVLVFLLMFTMGLAPDWAYELKTTPRRAMLGIACTTWALSCYSAWKLAAPEPLTTRGGVPTNLAIFPILVRHGARRHLRICAALFVTAPFVAQLGPRYNKGWEIILPALVSLLAGVFASWLYYHHVSRLAWRLGSRNISIQAKVLGVLNVLIFVGALMPGLSHAEDSLSGITKMPTIIFGSPQVAISTIRSIRHGYFHWGDLVYLSLFAWAFFVAVWLLTRLYVIRRLPGNGSENTPTSSAP